jgi:uncharacterized repeat protein (TIGR03803 family)
LPLGAASANSQTFTVLLQFSGTSGTTIGGNPLGSLTLSGTRLFAMTRTAGSNGYGNIFSVGSDGTSYQNLVSFTGTSGSASGVDPQGSLMLAGTTLYGMTIAGGANGYGNVFCVGTDGTSYQNLVSFTGTSGSASGWNPLGSLELGGTTIYGMTSFGGNSSYGSIFIVGTSGTNYHNLLSFTGTGGAASGAYPGGSLASGGTTLYGMTSQGGAGELGNIFSVGTDGTKYQNLVSFTGNSGTASGVDPQGSLTLGGTTLYGMTLNGGPNGYGNIFSAGTDGTSYRNLASFTGSGGSAAGFDPYGSLTLNGTVLYGMSEYGGTDSEGNIFSVGIDGSDYQNLYSFSGGTDGAYPEGDLTISGGTLFGMTNAGGAGYGTVFEVMLPTPTPESGTLALAGSAAAAALVWYRWRKMRWRRRNPP